MSEEIWTDLTIINCLNDSNKYLISSFGNIKNKNTGRIIKYRTSYGGYCSYIFYGKTYLVHRLVYTLHNNASFMHIDLRTCNIDNIVTVYYIS